MKLRASAKPTDAPMPAVPPTPTAALAATTVASMTESPRASRSTLPPLTMTLCPPMSACVRVRITLRATAPAPLTAMPAVPPPPMASEAAAVTASMRATVRASTTTSPVVVTLASVIDASTSLPMWFSAIATPTDTATAAVPPKAAAIDAAPAIASIDEVSDACRLRLRAPMPANAPALSAWSPSM